MEKLIKTRATIKGGITRIYTFVKTYTQNPTIIEEVMARLDPLRNTFERYENIQNQIEDLDETQLDDRIHTENQYYRVLAQINKLISDHKESNLNSSRNSFSHSSSNSTCQSQIKLPNVKMPTFSGNPQEYTSFMDLFSAIIDTNQSLSPVQKLYYLKSHLASEPLQLIDNLLLTNENYSIAIDILQNRYKNSLLIITSHIKSILDLPKIVKSTAVILRDFVTKLQQSLGALHSLEVPVEYWDLILVYIISNKLDYISQRAYELEKDKNTLPTMKYLISFLEHRAAALENVASTSKTQIKYPKVANITVQKNTDSFTKKSSKPQNRDLSCIYCSKSSHKIYKCDNFRALPVPQRLDFAKNSKLCLNCLGTKHDFTQCKSAGCYVCDKKHSTLLHSDISNEVQDKRKLDTAYSAASTSNSQNKDNQIVLLPTVCLKLKSNSGDYIAVKAILDSASQVCLITENLRKKLNLSPRQEASKVVGVSNCNTLSNQVVTVQIVNPENGSDDTVKCIIVDKIAPKLPQQNLNPKIIDLSGVPLADPTFFTPSSIDLLLSADFYFSTIRQGYLSLGDDLPVLQNTKYGYVVVGKLPFNDRNSYSSLITLQEFEDGKSRDNRLDEFLPKFWQLEDISYPKKLGIDELASWDSFQSSIKKIDGRFEVELPFRSPNSPKELGNSFNKCYFRFLTLEKKFAKDPQLFTQYKIFIDEYLALGHAKKIKVDFNALRYNSSESYFAPHQAVIRDQSSTTKLRVVFDCSMKTTSGKSLNDVLLSTPPPQIELFDILMKFRMYKYVFTTDIQKMFRNILVAESHQKYQRILWRERPTDLLNCLELKTVTYGTTCAPYLATSTLRYLAEINKSDFPSASEALLENCYVDDIAFGCNNLDKLLETKNQLVNLLALGSFQLHKFCSNSSIFMSNTPMEQREVSMRDILQHDHTKTLGILWSTHRDNFKVSIPDKLIENITKRSVLTFIASIFDPLGLLGCAVTPYKILMQTLWAHKLDWDTSLPIKLKNEWVKLQNGLPYLSNLEFPRQVVNNLEAQSFEIHVFSDASEKCYGAVIYLRTVYTNNTASSSLLCSKSRVAPLKKITLPRLELNSSLLLARLVSRVVKILKIKISNIYLWSDSTVTLHWIHGDPARWNPFVAHRVIEINEKVPTGIWGHVISKENAADVLSRGIEASVLNQHHSWFSGPKWLTEVNRKFEKFRISSDIQLPEQKRVALLTTPILKECTIDFQRFSSYYKLKRTFAYCLRFIENCRSKNYKAKNELSPDEIQNAEKVLFKIVQDEAFHQKKSQIEKAKPIQNSKLIPLGIFLHTDGLLRVGGRLENANISFDQRHPIILPAANPVSTLLVQAEHKKLLHAGPQLVLANLRLRYWPIGGRREIKKILRKCIICFRFKSKGIQQIMSPLPAVRVSCNRPFLNIGLDFAGPIMVRQSRIRKILKTKAYIALFICMAAKAVHIELVTDLTTECFILALKRFISRRGLPKSISSDNGSNFRGANNKLKDLFTSLYESTNKTKILNFLASNSIEWHFIPPLASHFGGLWESNIKSTKHHLYRTLGNAVLTFEETYTVLTQIEAILNSRSLTPLSDDPADLNYLTPGHFLIGNSLTTIPEKDFTNIPQNRLKFWNLYTKLQQQFWIKWQKDYINFLQQRNKWHVANDNIKLGTVVLIREKNLPPLTWALGRITHLHLSKDGKVRSVDVKTKTGTYTRPIVKLAALPFENNS